MSSDDKTGTDSSAGTSGVDANPDTPKTAQSGEVKRKSTNKCLHHAERPAAFVCSVCTKYFCEECVSERYYPRPAYICHHCSGEKPYEPPPEPEKSDTGTAEEADTPKAARAAPDWLVPGIEWLVIVACMGVIAFQMFSYFDDSHREIVLVSDQPEDVATYCLSKLDRFESDGAAPSFDEIKQVCPFPINVTEEDGLILVTTPDADVYGFSEIEIEPTPFLLTVME